jgi:hypothetical protein
MCVLSTLFHPAAEKISWLAGPRTRQRRRTPRQLVVRGLVYISPDSLEGGAQAVSSHRPRACRQSDSIAEIDPVQVDNGSFSLLVACCTSATTFAASCCKITSIEDPRGCCSNTRPLRPPASGIGPSRRLHPVQRSDGHCSTNSLRCAQGRRCSVALLRLHRSKLVCTSLRQMRMWFTFLV